MNVKEQKKVKVLERRSFTARVALNKDKKKIKEQEQRRLSSATSLLRTCTFFLIRLEKKNSKF